MKRIGYWLAGGIIVGVMLSGCKVSYPEGSAETSIKAICEKEYKVDVQVKSVGRTIGALVVQPEAILKDVSLSDRAFGKIENVMLTASRVTLSSAFKYDFFVVSLLDPDSGVQVSFIRYIKDIRRLITDDISRDDYFQRMLIKTSFTELRPGAMSPDYQLEDIQVKAFLADQIAERLKTQLMVNLITKRLFKIAAITTDYEPVSELLDRYPDAGQLIVTVHFLPDAPAFAQMGHPAIRDSFNQTILDVVQRVYRRYDFDGCEGLMIKDNRGPVMASYNREELKKGSSNILMQLLDSIKKK